MSSKEEEEVQPVVRPEAYSDRTAWMATYMAGTLKVSNMICTHTHTHTHTHIHTDTHIEIH